MCSASFWAIACDGVVKILNSRGISCQVYADDSCALIGGTDLHAMFKRMGQVLSELERWGYRRGLTFNAQKTEATLFTRRNINKLKQGVPKLKMSGKLIELTNKVKY